MAHHSGAACALPLERLQLNMANPPVAPYCSTSAVYYMVGKKVGSGQADFKPSGTPSKDTVEEWVENASSRIDGALHSAGYYVPLQAMEDETWPDWQTKFMAYFCAVGVASMISDDPTSPTFTNIHTGVRKGISRYRADWNVLIEGLEEKVAREKQRATSLVRALAYSGSNAESLLSIADPPVTAELKGYPHPSDADGLREWTKRSLIYMREQQKGHGPGWDPFSIDFLRSAKSSLGILATRQN